MTMRRFALSAMFVGLFATVGCDAGGMGLHRQPWPRWGRYQPFEETDSGATPPAAADAATRPVTDASTLSRADAATSPPADASTISTQAPKDPSVDGQCPSYIGASGAPLWGCCSKYGVCGTFAANTCLLPVGTQIPLDPHSTEDGGALPAGRCIPPKTK